MGYLLERDVGKAFKKELEKHEFLFKDKYGNRYSTRFEVYLNKHVPTNSTKFRRFWRTKNLDINEIPPAQPEMDMILVDKYNNWHAIELKVVKKINNRLTPSYYFGLGQTLGYLSFGFNEVAMWQCFDGTNISDDEIFYYDNALTRIRSPIDGVVGKTCFRLLNCNDEIRIQTAMFSPKDEKRFWQDGIGGYDEKTKTYRITSTSDNPFLGNRDPRVGAIREFLEKQKNELWDKPVDGTVLNPTQKYR